MAKSVDAADLKSADPNQVVGVRFPLRAPENKEFAKVFENLVERLPASLWAVATTGQQRSLVGAPSAISNAAALERPPDQW